MKWYKIINNLQKIEMKFICSHDGFNVLKTKDRQMCTLKIWNFVGQRVWASLHVCIQIISGKWCSRTSTWLHNLSDSNPSQDSCNVYIYARARVCVSVYGVGVSQRHLTMCASLPPPPTPHYNVCYCLRDLIWKIGFVVWAFLTNQITLGWWRGGTAPGGSWLALSGWDQPSRLVFENEWYPVWVVAAEERISVAFVFEVKFKLI